MRDSYKFLDRLIRCFQQKKIAIERNRLQQSQLNDKVETSLAEEQQVKEKMQALVSYTKQLKEQVRHLLSLSFGQPHRSNLFSI